MTKVIFVEANGNRIEATANVGDTLMQTAVNAGVSAIVAECGGACACATCHCYVADDWRGKLPEPDTMEADMLDFVMNPSERSRLSCQVVVTPEMDGIVIDLPESQT